MQKDKRYLLGCAESAAKFINEKGSGGFLNLLLDVIEISKDKFEDENTGKQYFCQIIYENKGLGVERLLGGGKTLSDSFKAFIESFLQISKGKEGYIIRNKEFNDLALDEFKYVLGWTRRLVDKGAGGRSKITSLADKNEFRKKSHRNNEPMKKNSHDRQNRGWKSYHNNQNDTLLNNSLATQLESLFKKGK